MTHYFNLLRELAKDHDVNLNSYNGSWEVNLSLRHANKVVAGAVGATPEEAIRKIYLHMNPFRGTHSMASIRKISIAGLLCLGALLLAGCGPYKLEHQVSGEVTATVKLDLTPAMFVPFFSVDCATRVSGQPCYDPDVSACASCMSSALYKYLTAGTQTP